ncbi:hypothetical protein [Pseudidiomarina sediminum]|uniref:hypothetical protein n=1 Tax=Pseudidiomarina sediminum TaxID=431675 RepID=UPI001C982C04|nr:hypothetical protein [Pseudidiomarina sediminum]MBY6063804.1 hypothetical protein [Pseudidiomarina sediminum]
MKHSFLVAGAALSMLAPISSSHAEERVLEVTGVVDILMVPYEVPEQGELTFTALITEDTAVPVIDEDTPFGDYGYYDAVKQVSIEVVDNTEQLVFSDTFVFPLTSIDDEEYGPNEGAISLFMPDAVTSDWIQPNATWYGAKVNDSQTSISLRVVALGLSPLLSLINDGGDPYMPEIDYQQDYPLFASLIPFPTLKEGSLVYPFTYAVSDELSENEEPEFSIGVYGIATNLRYLDVDADGDGVVDSEDACAISLLDEQVTLKGQLLTVENVVDGNGCSVMDHYAACEATQGEGGFLAYSGASYCEQQVAYQLYREGLIDYSDVRALRNALR